MIRRLTKDDHEQCFALLKTAPAENLFIIGDIEAYGYDQEFQKVWGDFSTDGKLIAVLLKYENNYIPFAVAEFDAEGFAVIMEQDRDFLMMSGLREVTAKIEPFLKKRLVRKRETYYAKCTKLQISQSEVSIVKKASPGEAERLVELVNQIPEFSDSIITVEKNVEA